MFVDPFEPQSLRLDPTHPLRWSVRVPEATLLGLYKALGFRVFYPEGSTESHIKAVCRGRF